MKLLLSLACTLATSAIAAVEFEAGGGYLVPRETSIERSPAPMWVDESERFSPFVAVNYGFTPSFTVRFSYQFVDNIRATAQFAYPPAAPGGPVLPVVVWGHFRDDVHIVAVAPEYRLPLRSNLTLGLAPQFNWVASRGRVAFSTDNPLVLLIAPYDRNDDGFTFGGAARALWTLNARTSLSLSYQYFDLEPSFNREAQVFSAAVLWKF